MNDAKRSPSEAGRATRLGSMLARVWRFPRDRQLRRRLRIAAGAFVVRALARRRMVGAVAPSSRRLAQAMALAAQGADLVVELGAGTGAVTAALIEAHHARPLIVVEIDARWADALRRRFPGIDVRCAPAHEALAQLALPASQAVVLVSSLPFRSLPPHWHRQTRAAIERFVRADPRRRLVQYTYQPRAPFEVSAASPLAWRCRHAVWHNLPPAWVWELGAAPA